MSNKGKTRIRPFGKVKYVSKSYRSWVVGIYCGLALGTYAIRPTYDFVKPFVYPVYAVEPTISNAISEGVVISSASNSAMLTPKVATPSASWQEFVEAVEKVAPMYNFPANVVLAQGALESARGNSTFAKERNNYLGIGAFDYDVNQAYQFENAEQCVVEYMRIIRKNFPEAWANRDNPDQLLYHLKHNKNGKVYATDPNYIAKVKSMKEWSN